MKLKHSLYFLILILLTQVGLAQDKDTSYKFTNNLYLSAQYGSGFLIAHRGSLESLVDAYTSNVFIEIAKSTSGQQTWQEAYNFPSLGIGYFRGNLGNDKIFGTANALYGFIEAPYFPQKKLSFGYKFGFGLAYLSKKYDLYDNVYNAAIGSHVNFLIHFSFDLKLNLLDQRLFFKTGLGFTHMSNGKIQTPNLGLNLVDWHLTAGYYIGRRTSYLSSKKITKRKRHTYMAIIAGGIKEFTEPNQGKYFAGNTTLEYEYSFKKKVSWGGGADIFYDGVVQKELELKKDANSSLHATRIGLHASYAIYYGKIGFIIQMGSYIAPYYESDGYLYHRVGFRVRASQHLLINLSMKTHWARASIVEFGLGYYITK